MNKTIPKLTIIVAVLLMFTLSATAAQFNKALVPADAQWVVHIDMNRFNKTLLKKLIFDDEDMKELNETKDQVMKEYKIDFLKDIHGITAFGMKSE
ncbi:MAG: hypothetical protein GY765_34005, partial [bacterium]|nr:hypothetical protein [bacterium]